MPGQRNAAAADRPVTPAAAAADAVTAFDALLAFCRTSDDPFFRFETALAARVAALAACLIRLFLAARDDRLDIAPYLAGGRYRPGHRHAPRALKTAYGEVTYARQYLIPRRGRGGFFPLDAALGLTRDRLTPWVLQWVAYLASRMSFLAAHATCRAALGWAPATETIEQVVLGMGRDAAAFLAEHPAASDDSPDGGVLVIEVDGKCPPTATDAELAKRRGKRRPRHAGGCRCGCQRHRGRARRAARGSKRRRKRGDKSKNGREAVVVVMYTLRRGADGRLHGPVNKKLYGTFAGRKAAAAWARAEATRRGFGPRSRKTVQVVMDGAKGLYTAFKPRFKRAIFTLDACHVVEKLWAVGRHYHPEGSAALAAWVDELKALVYAGLARALLRRLRALLADVPSRGPGTRGRRRAVAGLIGYVEPRVAMMRYGRWRSADLVIATGQVEGAVRHLVGERLDGSGMRWVRGKAEAVLHLRCVVLNGDWAAFACWFHERTRAKLGAEKRHKILTDQPLPLNRAA